MCKADITAIASRKGGGFKSTKDIAETISQIVEKLTRRGNLNDDQAIESAIADLSLKPIQPHVTCGRTASRRQRSQINISALLEHPPICEICKGYLNLESGKQYDHHFERFARVRRTSTENMRPVHPFCNNMRDQVEKVKGHASKLLIPNLPIVSQDISFDKRQLSLDV